MVWKEIDSVQVDDGDWEALVGFRSLEHMASSVLEYGCLDVAVEQRMELAQTFQALTVEEEVEVDTQLPVEGRLAVVLEVVDVRVQVLGEVRQAWTCLDVAVHEVLEYPHLDVVVHVDHHKRTQDPL